MRSTLPEIVSSSNRLASAALLAVAAAGTVFTALAVDPMHPEASVRPIYGSAMMCGGLAGWLHMRRGLGDGIGRAALGGVSAAISGLIYFMFFAGLRQVVRVYNFTQFNSVSELLEYMIERMVDVFWIAAGPPTLFTILIGGALAGMLSEAIRLWWD